MAARQQDVVSEILTNPVSIALITAFLMWCAGWVRTFLARRVHVQSPETQTIAKLVPAVNMLIDIQIPQTEALVALLEAAKGDCNGNVDKALQSTKSAKHRFEQYLTDSAKVTQ